MKVAYTLVIIFTWGFALKAPGFYTGGYIGRFTPVCYQPQTAALSHKAHGLPESMKRNFRNYEKKKRDKSLGRFALHEA